MHVTLRLLLSQHFAVPSESLFVFAIFADNRDVLFLLQCTDLLSGAAGFRDTETFILSYLRLSFELHQAPNAQDYPTGTVMCEEFIPAQSFPSAAHSVDFDHSNMTCGSLILSLKVLEFLLLPILTSDGK